jgi:carbonic anhydrase/acetyltransferase-like protein (isoleucine patch superfamily)
MNPFRPFKGINPTVGNNCFIDSTSVIIGDVNVGDDVSIWPLVVIRGDVNCIKVGNRTNIQDASVLHVTRVSNQYPEGFPLSIGDDVTIGHKVMLHGCTIGNRILIGMGAIIMDGAVIEDDVFIGAGALVPPNKVLESGYLYVGNPVKKARPLKEGELAFLKTSAENYLETKDEHIAEQTDNSSCC